MSWGQYDDDLWDAPITLGNKEYRLELTDEDDKPRRVFTTDGSLSEIVTYIAGEPVVTISDCIYAVLADKAGDYYLSEIEEA
jgi:hypothetical protein